MDKFLAFDIETDAEDFDSLSESQREYILRRAETDEEIEQKKAEMALSPLTSRVVCIGMKMVELVNPDAVEREERYREGNLLAYSLDETMSDGDTRELALGDGNTAYISNERTLLAKFWKIFQKYPQIHLISFNGRNFDTPFLMLRSAKLQIRPSRNLMAGTKFNYPNHTDLIDELTFYMGGQQGATRRYNFDFYTRALGIESPKSMEVNGSKVGEMYAAGEIDKISEYCLRDVRATWDLYLYWEKYLKF